MRTRESPFFERTAFTRPEVPFRKRQKEIFDRTTAPIFGRSTSPEARMSFAPVRKTTLSRRGGQRQLRSRIWEGRPAKIPFPSRANQLTWSVGSGDPTPRKDVEIDPTSCRASDGVRAFT